MEVNISGTLDLQFEIAAVDITLIAKSGKFIIMIGYATILQYINVDVAIRGSYITAEADVAFSCVCLQVDVASRAVDNIAGSNAAFGVIINILLSINLSAGCNAAITGGQEHISFRSNISVQLNITCTFNYICSNISAGGGQCAVRFNVAIFCNQAYVGTFDITGISNIATFRVEHCFTSFCSNIAFSVDIACLSNKLNITSSCINTLC